MTEIKRYKLYKHKKQWVIGCSALLFSLTLGAANAHAATDTSTSTENQSTSTLVVQPAQQLHSQSQQENSQSRQQIQLVTSQGEAKKNVGQQSNNGTTNSLQSNKAAGTVQQRGNAPVAYSGGPSSPRPNDDTVDNYERIIRIQYYPHYDLNGSVTGEPVRHEIVQHAVNGHWDAVDWYPPVGTFPAGVTVPPVHFDATDEVTRTNQEFEVNYWMRTVIIQTADPSQNKYHTDLYALTNGQVVNVPEMEIDNGTIPSWYRPTVPSYYVDSIVERNGHYYLTGGQLRFQPHVGIVYQDGDQNTGGVNMSEMITFTTPVNIEYDDLNGTPYNAYGDNDPSHIASYQHVTEAIYGRDLTPYQINWWANRQFNDYISRRLNHRDSTYQIEGYFTPTGQYHQGTPRMADATVNGDHLTFHIAVVHRVYGPVANTRTTKTRTIIVREPGPAPRTITQTVTLQQFNYHDGITGEAIPGDAGSAPVWEVLVDPARPADNDSWHQLSDDNHSWAEYDAPTVSGYTPNIATVRATEVTADTPDTVVTIDYTADDDNPVKPVKPEQPVSPNHGGTAENAHNDGISGGHGTALTTEETKQGQSQSVVNNSHSATQQTANKLPQTGNDHAQASILALAGLGLAAMLGLGYRKQD